MNSDKVKRSVQWIDMYFSWIRDCYFRIQLPVWCNIYYTNINIRTSKHRLYIFVCHSFARDCQSSSIWFKKGFYNNKLKENRCSTWTSKYAKELAELQKMWKVPLTKFCKKASFIVQYIYAFFFTSLIWYNNVKTKKKTFFCD